jgi:hypothetical protein
MSLSSLFPDPAEHPCAIMLYQEKDSKLPKAIWVFSFFDELLVSVKPLQASFSAKMCIYQ